MISRNEALLLLDRLCERKRVRCCISTSSILGFWFEGKLHRDGETIFLNAPNFALHLALVDDMGFEYAETQKVMGIPSVGGMISGLGIALPLRMTLPRDKVFFFEVEE